MTDERMEELLGAWMRSSVAPEPDARRSAAAVLERLDVEASTQTRWPPWSGGALAPYLSVAAGLAIVAVIAGLLFALLPSGKLEPEDPQNAVVGVTPSLATTSEPDRSEGPPIHWQSDQVDFRAQGMTLRIDDEVYTGEGAVFSLDSENTGDSWAISPSWFEGGRRHELQLSFWLEPGGQWSFPGVRLVTPDMVGADGSRFRGGVSLGPMTRRDRGSGLAVDQAFAGEYAESGTLKRPTCDGFGFETLDVVLEFRGLQVMVTPHEPSVVDRVLETMAEAPDAVARAVDANGPANGPIQLECPDPLTTETSVGSLSLTIEPLGSDVGRVLGDGERDLDLEVRDVAVDDDGRVVITTPQGIIELGSAAPPTEVGAVMKHVRRADFMPDGAVLVRGGEQKTSTSTLAIVQDGDVRRLPSLPDLRSGTLNSPVFTEDGSLWAAGSGVIGRYDGTEWTRYERRLTSPLAAAEYQVGMGPTKGLAVTSTGEVWMGVGHTLSEYRDGEWVEHTPLDEITEGAAGGIRASVLDLDIGGNDALWAYVAVSLTDGDGGFAGLVRRFDEQWSVHSLDEVMPNALIDARHILVDGDGAVLLLLRERPRAAAPSHDGARLIRFDGKVATELARFPSQLGYRLADVGPDGTVWVVGGGPTGTVGDRIHIVTPPAEASAG